MSDPIRAALERAARELELAAIVAKGGFETFAKRAKNEAHAARAALAAKPLPDLQNMNLLDRITIDPAVRFGKPCVRGTRLTVGDVLGTLASGGSEAELFKDFPQPCHEDVLACLAFAAERELNSCMGMH